MTSLPLNRFIYLPESPFLPFSQRQLLRRALERSVFKNDRIVFSGEMHLALPLHWKCKQWVGEALLIKYLALTGQLGNRVFYLDPLFLIRGDLSELENALSTLTVAADAPLLRDTRLLYVGEPRALPALESLSYEDVATIAFENNPWPEKFLPMGPKEIESAPLLDLLPRNVRPWLHSHSPYSALWLEELQAALAEGALTPTQVLQDVRSGRARSSLAYQVERNAWDVHQIPDTDVYQDTQLDTIEFAPDTEQRRLLRTPMLICWLNERRRLEKTFTATPAALDRKHNKNHPQPRNRWSELKYLPRHYAKKVLLTAFPDEWVYGVYARFKKES